LLDAGPLPPLDFLSQKKQRFVEAVQEVAIRELREVRERAHEGVLLMRPFAYFA
jgi:hypothetical protein